jgi:hypothetical protein
MDKTIKDERAQIFCELDNERKRQDAKWGEQNHPIRDESRDADYKETAELLKALCNFRAKAKTLTWFDIAAEEFLEVFAEDTPERQREELIQLGAVVVSMVECIDRKQAGQECLYAEEIEWD